MAFPQRPTLDTLAVTRPVARRLSDRAVFAWGVAWSTLALGAVLGPLATLKLHRLQHKS